MYVYVYRTGEQENLKTSKSIMILLSLLTSYYNKFDDLQNEKAKKIILLLSSTFPHKLFAAAHRLVSPYQNYTMCNQCSARHKKQISIIYRDAIWTATALASCV